MRALSDVFSAVLFSGFQISKWPRGVTVSTLDSESSNRGSNPRKASWGALRRHPQRAGWRRIANEVQLRESHVEPRGAVQLLAWRKCWPLCHSGPAKPHTASLSQAPPRHRVGAGLRQARLTAVGFEPTPLRTGA